VLLKKVFESMYSIRNLEYLNLRRTIVGEAEGALGTLILNNKNLKTINISECRLKFTQELQNAFDHADLSVLNVCDNDQINFEGIIDKCSGLTHLSLGGKRTRLGKLNLKRLRYLFVTDCDIGEEDARVLCSIADLPQNKNQELQIKACDCNVEPEALIKLKAFFSVSLI